MVQYVEAPCRTFQAGAALAQYRRVRLSTGKLAYASATDVDAVGHLERPTFAADEQVAVRLPTAPGTRIGVAASSCTVGALMYAAANGKIDDSGTVLVGVALEAAGADGDLIEYLPLFRGTDATS